MNEPITATERISSVLKRDEKLVEVLVAFSPTFSKLKNPIMRRTMAALVTVEQAAQIAGVDARALVDRLNQALGESPASGSESEAIEHDASTSTEPPTEVPEELKAIPEAQRIECDVREDLRAGREPFQKIMAAVKSVSPGQVLRVRATFEPVPLYSVLGKRGLEHFTERLADDDWRIWFFHGDSAQVGGNKTVDANTDETEDFVVIDVRGLEPPEPMMRTFEALEALPVGKTLVQINVRVPQFLIPKLDERGFTYEVRQQAPDVVRVLIRHKTS